MLHRVTAQDYKSIHAKDQAWCHLRGGAGAAWWVTHSPKARRKMFCHGEAFLFVHTAEEYATWVQEKWPAS